MGPKKNIQLLKCGINDEMYEMYPELKEKRVGFGCYKYRIRIS